MRASLCQETLNNFLFVKESMGPVATFDPRQNCKILQKSIAKWMPLRKRHPKTTESADKVQHYMTNEFVKTVFSSSINE